MDKSLYVRCKPILCDSLGLPRRRISPVFMRATRTTLTSFATMNKRLGVVGLQLTLEAQLMQLCFSYALLELLHTWAYFYYNCAPPHPTRHSTTRAGRVLPGAALRVRSWRGQGRSPGKRPARGSWICSAAWRKRAARAGEWLEQAKRMHEARTRIARMEGFFRS